MPDLPIDAVCSFTKSPRSSHTSVVSHSFLYSVHFVFSHTCIVHVVFSHVISVVWYCDPCDNADIHHPQSKYSPTTSMPEDSSSSLATATGSDFFEPFTVLSAAAAEEEECFFELFFSTAPSSDTSSSISSSTCFFIDFFEDACFFFPTLADNNAEISFALSFAFCSAATACAA